MFQQRQYLCSRLQTWCSLHCSFSRSRWWSCELAVSCDLALPEYLITIEIARPFAQFVLAFNFFCLEEKKTKKKVKKKGERYIFSPTVFQWQLSPILLSEHQSVSFSRFVVPSSCFIIFFFPLSFCALEIEEVSPFVSYAYYIVTFRFFLVSGGDSRKTKVPLLHI